MEDKFYRAYVPGPRLFETDQEYVRAGKLLQLFRKMDDITVDELAERASLQMPIHPHAPDLSIGYLVRYERGRLAPHREHLVAMEKIVGQRGALLDAFGFDDSDDIAKESCAYEASLQMHSKSTAYR